MKQAFKILFAVDILHDYFANGLCPFFKFVPSDDTRALLTNCNAIYKVVGNKLLVIIKTGEDNKPLKPPTNADRFVFYLELMQPVFTTISAPEIGIEAIKRFYCCNLYDNTVSFSATDEIFHLTQSLKNYDANSSYKAGDMVIDNDTAYECVQDAALNETPVNLPLRWSRRATNTYAASRYPAHDITADYQVNDMVSDKDIIYKCLQKIEGSPRPGIADAAFWKPFLNNQFATTNDLLRILPTQFAYTLGVGNEAREIRIKVFSLNKTNNQFDVLSFSDVQFFETPVSAAFIDLSKLKDGKYKLLVNDKPEWIFISNMAAYNNYFAVVEIFNHLPAGNRFSFYKADGTVKDEVIDGKNKWLSFAIRFANRLAFVKYIVPKKGVAGIDSNPSTGVFIANGNPAKSFQSRKRLPMQEKTAGFEFSLIALASSSKFPAPNADINIPGILTKEGNDYYCNIYLNY